MKWWEKLALAACVALIAGFAFGATYQAGFVRGSLDSLIYCARSRP